MKRIITSLVAAILLATTTLSQATSYGGYVRNWWVQENGDFTFYFLDATNSNWVTGMCGSALYVLQMGKTNYTQLQVSLLMAAKNNYKVLMEVTTCSGSMNIIKMAKVCTWTGDC
ncbi:MAG: hypothetical protein E6R05_05870 [Candidatus Moraniibacteriota bacterium]|nr:MAG: hypothetical protein E6R05_05870 [Candidatus Moranbacteria bacterium]